MASPPPASPPKPPAPKAPAPPPLVLIHGLGVVPQVWTLHAWRFRRAGREVHVFGYNSYGPGIPQIAERIARRMAELGPGPLDVATHSMGGIVLRWAFNNHPIPRLRRVVMIGPPNRGASFADFLDHRVPWLARPVLGDAFLQLRTGDLGLAARAGTLPGVEVGVIAGGRGQPRGLNPFIDGDNDRLVGVQETLLPGMKDFLLVRADHTWQLVSPKVSRAVLHFLDHGRFPHGAEPKPRAARAPAAEGPAA
ncbi:MAG: hypothetical protein SF028_02810 [Candidatus Sumerlaeia bacterium]|nr:hypothetical protein [Candidatus Sumerlaeia bacterium]